MQQLDLNLLAALDALLQEGSVVAASEKLGITPSAMSRALARIRQQTGDPVMVRAGRGLVPTPRALEISSRVHNTVEEARALLARPTEANPADFSRVFSIRADDSVGSVVGPRLLEDVRSIAPGVSIVFCSEGAEDVADLREGRIDLDVGVQGDLGPEVRTRKLIDDQRVVLARGAAPKKSRRLTLAAYAKREHIDVSRRGKTRGQWTSCFRNKGSLGPYVPSSRTSFSPPC